MATAYKYQTFIIIYRASVFHGHVMSIAQTCDVLDVALQLGIPYVDVCDEKKLCEVAKKKNQVAQSRGMAAIVAAGIWPGVSAMLAALCVDKMRASGSVRMDV
jgi:saccharopine dehydrogenase-like NADP-dependent oxidoreductase